MKHSLSIILAVVYFALRFFPMFSLPFSKHTVSAKVNEIDHIRIRWKDYLTGGRAYNTHDPDISKQISYITRTADGVWRSMIKSEEKTVLWEDLSSLPDSAQITKNYQRIYQLALAYETKGSGLEGNAQLKQDIVDALDWMYINIYNEKKDISGNWWDWKIGASTQLVNLVVLMYEDLTPGQVQNYLKAIEKFCSDVDAKATASNILYEAKVIALHGVIARDSNKLGQARDSITRVLEYVKEGDGFYEDGSFLQHDKFAYTGSYGVQLLSDLTSILYLLGNSSWEVTDPGLLNIYKWVHDSFEPLIYKGAIMDMVRGRAIARPWEDHTQGHEAIRTILQLSQIAPENEALALKSMIKYWILEDSYKSFFTSSIYNIQLAKQLMNDRTVLPRGEMVRHKQFASMDRVVHLRPGFGYGISMSSNRIFNYESINGENLKGWYTGDGMTYLYNGDLGQYSDGYWPVIDKYRLPGTTVDSRIRDDESGTKYLSSEGYAGGTELSGIYGIAGMKLDAFGSSLEAKKSWFMFDDEIVALGAGITNPDYNATETIIENRKLNGKGDNILAVNGQQMPRYLGWSEDLEKVSWMHLAGSTPDSDIGYYFPHPVGVKGLREARTGSWKEVNRLSGSAAPITRNFMTLWFDHGTYPVDETYSYVLLPNMTAGETSAYSVNPDIAVLKNTKGIQAVRERKLGITGVNFWDSGSIDFIHSSSSASVMVQENGGSLEIAVSDFTHKQQSILIELDRSASLVSCKDSSVKVLQLSPKVKFEVDVENTAGKTHKISFENH